MKTRMSFVLAIVFCLIFNQGCIVSQKKVVALNMPVPPAAPVVTTGDIPEEKTVDPADIIVDNSSSILSDFDSKGNGCKVTATATGFTLTIVDKAPLKISIPFIGVNSDGYISAKAGMVLQARAAWAKDTKEMEVIKSISVGIDESTGVINYIFSQNPSSLGKPVDIVVNHGNLVVGGQKNQWLCPPWGRIIHFAKAHSGHPKGVHSFRFTLEGAIVRDAISVSSKFGWEPSLPFHGY